MSGKFDETLARMDLELHCDALLSALSLSRDDLIQGRLPPRVSPKRVEAQGKESLAAAAGKVVAAWGRKRLTQLLSINGSVADCMFWEDGDPPGIRGGDLSLLFPAGKDAVIRDLRPLLERTLFLKRRTDELPADARRSNEAVLNDVENQIGWVWILNRHASNVLMAQFDDAHTVCTDMKKIIKSTNVLGRHVLPKNGYKPIV